MKRRMFLAAAAASAGCSRLPRKVLVPVPPDSVGEWRRAAMDTPEPAGAPEPAAGLRPAQWIRATFANGQRLIGVSAFAFTTEAAAFELQQKWNRGSGDVTYQKKSVLVVCKSETEGVRELLAFVKRLESSWP